MYMRNFEAKLKIHSFVNSSFVNGPGNRFVLWTQGCTKKCKNCFNPLTWDKNGKEYSVLELFEIIKRSNVDGITLTGGDPLEQPDELLSLLLLLEGLNLSKGIILFTGFTIEEIERIGNSTLECLRYVDLLIDGRYIDELYINDGLRGSSNQNFYYFSDKLKEEEIKIDHEIEIGFNNGLFVTGFPHVDRKILKQFGIIMK